MPFFQELLNSGAPVSYLILGFFILATFLFFHRFFYLHRANIDLNSFLLGIKNNMKNSNAEKTIEAISICEETRAPVASVAKSIISRNTKSELAMRRAAEEAATIEIPRLQGNTRLIAAIGQFTPLLGLLGTVIALMSLFQEIGAGTNGASMSIAQMAPHVRTALVTTAMGICSSIIIVLYNTLLSERCHSIVFDMEKCATELINFLAENEDAAEQINKELVQDRQTSSGQ